MNNDLISRSALRAEAIEMEIFQPYGGDGSCMGVTVGTIDCAPAVDAVEVVRCKDCIYKEITDCCPAQSYGFYMPHDWYCPMGIKKDVEVQDDA